MITLIIVDCQNDFISGTLSVPKARNVLDNIKDFIQTNVKDIDKIIFTVDWHPVNHCSFTTEGGTWNPHCVQYTPGACIEPKLLKLVHRLKIPYQVSQKGEIQEVEQYGAFSDIEYVSDYLGSRFYLDSVVEVDANTEFIVCGIAGDFCVKETIKNMLDGGIFPKVFLNGIASIDGSIIRNYIKDSGLEII